MLAYIVKQQINLLLCDVTFPYYVYFILVGI